MRTAWLTFLGARKKCIQSPKVENSDLAFILLVRQQTTESVDQPEIDFQIEHAFLDNFYMTLSSMSRVQNFLNNMLGKSYSKFFISEVNWPITLMGLAARRPFFDG